MAGRQIESQVTVAECLWIWILRGSSIFPPSWGTIWLYNTMKHWFRLNTMQKKIMEFIIQGAAQNDCGTC
jgi:hypothetical protein